MRQRGGPPTSVTTVHDSKVEAASADLSALSASPGC